MRTKARIRHKRMERVHRQANDRLAETLSADQRQILVLAQEGYEPTEIARELALPPDYVNHFMHGLVQRLTHAGLIPSPEWKHALTWAKENSLIITSPPSEPTEPETAPSPTDL